MIHGLRKRELAVAEMSIFGCEMEDFNDTFLAECSVMQLLVIGNEHNDLISCVHNILLD